MPETTRHPALTELDALIAEHEERKAVKFRAFEKARDDHDIEMRYCQGLIDARSKVANRLGDLPAALPATVKRKPGEVEGLIREAIKVHEGTAMTLDQLVKVLAQTALASSVRSAALRMEKAGKITLAEPMPRAR